MIICIRHTAITDKSRSLQMCRLRPLLPPTCVCYICYRCRPSASVSIVHCALWHKGRSDDYGVSGRRHQ